MHKRSPIRTYKRNNLKQGREKSNGWGKKMVCRETETQKAERKRESCQWKWAVLQEASGWACENHISLFSEHWRKMPPSLSLSSLSKELGRKQIFNAIHLSTLHGNSLDVVTDTVACKIT